MNAQGPALALGTMLFAVSAALSTASASAQDLSPSIRASAACAPVGTPASARAPRVSKAQPPPRTIFHTGEQIAIESSGDAVQVNQRFFVRRPMSTPGGLPAGVRAQLTIGWLHIVSVNEATATGHIDFTCDAIAVGDYLEPYVEPSFPAGIDRTDTAGPLDFTKSARVLYGTDTRVTGGGRDYMLIDAGQDRSVQPGARYAVYHGKGASGASGLAFAEAVVVSVFPDKSVLRLTAAHDAVSFGDTVVARAAVPAAAAVAGEPIRVVQQRGGEGGEGGSSEPSLRLPVSEDPVAQARTVAFDDVFFDFNRYSLRPEAKTLLDGAVKALQDDPLLKIRIEGHTCNVGTAEYNLALGERRANVVRDYLIEKGIATSRVSTVSLGEEQPKYDNAHKETRRKNRRAVLLVNLQRSADTASAPEP
jgi:outer membrane protein OmpA-like peptidoglycan-associated protein